MSATEYIQIPPIIKGVVDKAVSKVQAELTANNNGEPVDHWFVHGTPQHIVERLVQRASDPINKNKRFPLIALVHNYRQDFNSQTYYSEAQITLWIINLSKPDVRYEDRYSGNFLQVLYPIWQSIIKQLRRSGYVESSQGIQHSTIERPNWGLFSKSNQASELGELIDGIEVELNIKLNYNNCLKQNKQNLVTI